MPTCSHVRTVCVPKLICGGQRAPTMWIPGFELRSSGLAASAFTHFTISPALSPSLRPLGSRHKGVDDLAVTTRPLFAGATGRRDTGFAQGTQDQSRPFPRFCLGRSSRSCLRRGAQACSFPCSRRSLESRPHGRRPPSRASQRRGSD